MLTEKTLFGTVDKVTDAIAILREHEPEAGYYLAFSGGKDSCVIKELADMAGVKYDAHYHDTTIDPPELRKFIREYYPDVTWDKPEKSFFQLVPVVGFPLRQVRWCCRILKERGGAGRSVIIGIRRDESPRRSKRQAIETDKNDETRTLIHPIIEWTEYDVWNFIESRDIPYCKLYDEGRGRIGCLMCPNAGKKQRLEDAEQYPKYRNALELAFVKLYENRKAAGKTSVNRWKDGKEMFEWWLNEDKKSIIDGQGELYD